MTTGGELSTRVAQLEERMKTQHAETNTCSANHSRRRTSQIDHIHETLDNMEIDARKREVRFIVVMIAAMAFSITIIGLLKHLP